jgi:fucose 4-O-acetylase-like acetyltransferase
MRGFAVVVMVLGHSIDAVLGPDARATEVFRIYDALRGFTAPLFLFISGYAFAVVTAPRWGEFAAFAAPARKRVGKMAGLLVLGYALHFPFFSLNKLLYNTRPEEYAMMFQVDILHCLAVSIIMLQLLVVLTRTRERFLLVTAAAGTLIVLLSPLIWLLDLRDMVPAIIAPYLSQQQPSLFPLFPFSAYLFAGAVTGLLYMKARSAGRESAFFRRVAHLSALAVATGLVCDLLPLRVYPAHDFWKTGPDFFAIRLGAILMMTTAFFAVRRLPPAVGKHLVVLGKASLLVYAVHLVLVYGSAANDGLMQIIGQRLDPFSTLCVAAGVLLLMLTSVHAWNAVRERHDPHWRVLQAGFTSTLLYFFLTRPY